MTLVLKACLVLLVSVVAISTAADEPPYLYVLGVAQDAGFPQAGCYKPHCMPGWEKPETKIGATSLALIDPASKKKYIFEATPDFPEQLFMLEQEASTDEFELSGIFITHAHIGHYTGLMYLGREVIGADQMPVYVMPKMKRYLTNNGPWSQLIDLNNIELMTLNNRSVVELSNLQVTPFIVPHRDEFSETVGFSIKGPNKTALFIPDINKWSQWERDIADQVQASDYALIDATFFNNGELPGRDMSKIPHPLVTETMDALSNLSKEHRAKVWFIHMNHTNPLLNLNSEQAKIVRAEGYNIASTGLRLSL
ncbi:MAG: pyrroloquinoline quinone biosynthesis protein PqqB [SAR92 bacterium BACL26 MAG-121220-bin70]|jgi:pyrroloquinoline quinone biosynthesis protein B|uniref:Pyrroloquinoline quinone biosynthesis protein PqqB n=1 Tax=SAR92 bacterium BACL26 MAG-121220-bin70 TaxID=1655626 RepID=A0A0R2U7K4_9GAMM|nr:MAG: pyrroloquinoline quinone biosynthesis protein PqqB [SAR92 bacterium BACL26 MAG-121220-bin70]